MTRVFFPSAACIAALCLCGAAPPAAPGTSVAASDRPDGSTVQVQPEKAASSHSWRYRQGRRRQASPVLRDVSIANAVATEEPALRGFINAVQVYPFADGMVFHVYTTPGQVSDITLQPGETLGAVASGDTVRWVIGDTTSGTGESKRTHVLVKPFSVGLSTNLVITTDRRSYHLVLTSTARTAMAALSWTYPQDDLIALRKATDEQAAAVPIATGLAIDDLHFDYSISGDQHSWRPLRAFDDGRQTFIEFPAGLSVGDAPPLFIVDAKGSAQLVNYRVHGRFYVVDRLFDAAEHRLGTKHQEIVRIDRGAATNGHARGRAA